MAPQPTATYYILICGHHTLMPAPGESTITETTKINHVFDRTPCRLCRGNDRSGEPIPPPRDPTAVDLERVDTLFATFKDTLRKLEEDLETFESKVRNRFPEATILAYELDTFITDLLLCKDNQLRTSQLEARFHFSRFSYLIDRCRYFGASQPGGKEDVGRARFFDFCRNEATRLFLAWKKAAMRIGKIVELLEEAKGQFDGIAKWLDEVEVGKAGADAHEETRDVSAGGDVWTGGAGLRVGACAGYDGISEFELHMHLAVFRRNM